MKCSCNAFIAYCPCCGKSLIASMQHHSMKNTSKEDDKILHKEASTTNNTVAERQRTSIDQLPCRAVSAFELFCVRYAPQEVSQNNNNNNVINKHLSDEVKRKMAECWLKADSATRHTCEMEATQWSQIWENKQETSTDAGLTSDYRTVTTNVNKNNSSDIYKTDIEEQHKVSANIQTPHKETELTRSNSEFTPKKLANSAVHASTRDVCNFMLNYKRNRDKRRRNNIDYLTNTKKELDRKRAKMTSLSSLEVINSFSVFCRIMKGRKLSSGERSQIWRRMTPAEKAPFDEAAARLRTEKYLSNLK